mgnify:FL=1
MLKKYKTWQELQKYLRTQNTIEELASFADKKGIKKNPYSIKKSGFLIQNLIEAYICRDMIGDKGFYPVINQTDITLKKAIETLSEPQISKR